VGNAGASPGEIELAAETSEDPSQLKGGIMGRMPQMTPIGYLPDPPPRPIESKSGGAWIVVLVLAILFGRFVASLLIR
jgi:hypothetical protein